jgi:hypothetical protein
MIAQAPTGPAQATQADELAGRIGARLSEILEHASRLAEARAERARRNFLRKAVGIGLLAFGGIVATTLALAATWQLARGLAQGIGAWTGRAWLGDLLSGLLLLALVLGLAAFALARSKPGPEQALETTEREAWDGLKNSATELGEDLVQTLRVRETVREHPYVSLGGGLAAGFALAPLLRGLLGGIGPLARLALSDVPGIAPILRRAHAQKHPTNSAP